MMRTIQTSLFGVLLLLLFFSSHHTVYAAGSLYLSPSAKTVPSGTRFSVAVRTNTGGDAVNAVQANLSYDTGKLDFISVSGAGSSFAIDASSGGGGGGISISRGSIGTGVSGDRLVATITFRVKGEATGTAGVSFSGGSALVRGSDQANILGGTPGGTYTIGAASPSSSSTTTQPLLQQIPTPSPTLPQEPLTIQSVAVNTISYRSAVVAWTTNREALSLVEYGLNDTYGLLAQTPGLTTTHEVTLDSELLTPGVSYHFHVKSIDAASIQAESKDSTFQTKGIPVGITVKDEKGTPLSKAEVTMIIYQEPRTQMTNRSGTVLFEHAAPGKQIVAATFNNATATQVIAVSEPTKEDLLPATLAPQQFSITVSLPTITSSLSWMPQLLIAIAVIMIGTIAFFMVRKLRNTQQQPPVTQA